VRNTDLRRNLKLTALTVLPWGGCPKRQRTHRRSFTMGSLFETGRPGPASRPGEKDSKLRLEGCHGRRILLVT
jgi:hypothetical protein